MKHIFRYVIFAVILYAVAACSGDDSCREERYVAMGMQLYQTTFDESKEAYVINNFIPDSITICGVANDSVLYEKSTSSIFYLPLQQTINETRYVLYANGVYDTLTVEHENNLKYLSLECGYIVFSTIKEARVTTHKIDSVSIKVAELINYKTTHIQVYYKTE